MDSTQVWKSCEIPYGNGKSLKIKNRYMIPPMVTFVSEDGFVNQFHLSRYNGFAMGGFGIITLEASAVTEHGRLTPGCLGIWKDDHIPKLRELTDSIHQPYYNGTKVGIQLNHGGRKSSISVPWENYTFIPSDKGGFPLVAPSSIPFSPERESPKEMSTEEVKEMIVKYVDAAERAQKAGFDFVEVHAAHGFLINQFLCKSTNKRTDEYGGGSFESRTRFLREVVTGIMERCGKDNLPVFVRFSCDEGLLKEKEGDEEFNEKVRKSNEERWKIEDTLKCVKIMIDLGVSLIDCSSQFVNSGEQFNATPCHQVKYAEDVKKEFGDQVKVSAVGMIRTVEEIESILKEGKADFVMLGRPALMNPYTPFLQASELGIPSKEIVKKYVVQHGFTLERELARLEKKKE